MKRHPPAYALLLPLPGPGSDRGGGVDPPPLAHDRLF